MAHPKHTGRTGPLLAKSGLVAAFLAGTGAATVAQNARADGIVRCWGYNGDGQCNTPADLGACSSVAGGFYHTIALRSDGGVRCWGYNNYGQCDPPADLGACSSIAGGLLHTIALRTDGGVRCWGYNDYGQCYTPADLGACSSVAGGREHTIALRSDGIVRCWGAGLTNTGSYPNYGQSNPPADLGPCSSIAGGYYHTIALRIDGGVRCWGYNDYGQCNTPADLGTSSSIAGGVVHTLALRSDGGVRCWGSNDRGQCYTPADLGPCASIAAGARHTIALRSDGIVRCWGAGFTNTGSYPNYGQSNPPADLGPCLSIAGSANHTIAILGPTPLDTDGDGRPDSTDNCPTIANPTQADCNNNGVGDVCEIADTCQCLADLFVDRQINGADLGVLLSQWGPATVNTASDMNRDGVVNGADLGYLLNAWGACSITVPSWATLVQAEPSVINPTMSAAITASGLAWRVRDTATQIEMLLVPAGTFTMGNLSNEPAENPPHSVTLTQAFYLGRYEVTQEQWVASMGSNPSTFSAANGFPNVANRPVERVSWNAAQDYLSATGMRLPSEAEWEYACRAGTTTTFYSGEDVNIGNIAWYTLNSGSKTHAVGGKTRNQIGFYDMSGNVWEWVNDWYDPNYYSVSPSTNPLGPVSGPSHVLRGGSWTEYAYSARSASRSPGYTSNNVGFRVARNP